MKPKIIPSFILLAALSIQAIADEEFLNRPVVKSSEYGAVYAKSIPDDGYGQKGETRVFSVGKDIDTLICEYGWYASEIYIGGSGERTLIRFGPWHRGNKPQDDHLALGIYRDGKTIREYSTLEMQKLGSGISRTKSHYKVFNHRIGFKWTKENQHVYDVEGVDGNLFSFDLDTGKLP